MDRSETLTSAVISLNKFNSGKISEAELIKSTLALFDLIKRKALSDSDMRFLRNLGSRAGIPHYFEMLLQINNAKPYENDSLNDFANSIYEATLHTTEALKLHRYQAEVLSKFASDKENRYLLSASTSFGKTHLAIELIRKMNYSNIAMIFPTISLLSENSEKLLSDPNYAEIASNYAIHTLSSGTELKEKNIFIFTPERFLSLIDFSIENLQFDFAFIDEVYKLESKKILDGDEVRENQRDITYRLAILEILKRTSDMLLAGPYIEFKSDERNSFSEFLKKNRILPLNYNKIEIVGKSTYEVAKKGKYEFEDDLKIDISERDKKKITYQIGLQIAQSNENAIIYCHKRLYVERLAKSIADSIPPGQHDHSEYDAFLNHLRARFNPKWSIIHALERGIGTHHGLIPKYIQKEIIKLFNNGNISVLLATTTITEGVNTSAKNIIILESKKGRETLTSFDAKNIAGRAGRFIRHFQGRVISVDSTFLQLLQNQTESINHILYDLDAPKGDVDLFAAEQEYLNSNDVKRKSDLAIELEKRGIPKDLIDKHKTISIADKIKIYDAIFNLSNEEIDEFRKLRWAVATNSSTSHTAFEVIVRILNPIVTISPLSGILKARDRNGNPLLSSQIHSFLKGGFMGSIDFYYQTDGEDYDKAVRSATKFVYSTIKYQVTKYLGVLNTFLMYRLSALNVSNLQDYSLEFLLAKLEYNATTREGKIASDYGVPYKIVSYFETKNENERNTFDSFESESFQRVTQVIQRTNVNDGKHS